MVSTIGALAQLLAVATVWYFLAAPLGGAAALSC